MATKVVRNLVQVGTQPYRFTLTAIDLEGRPSLVLPYNPEAYDENGSAKWSADGRAGAERDRSNWEGNEPRQMAYQQLLTARDFAGAGGVDFSGVTLVEGILLSLQAWAQQPTLSTQRPTLVRVTAGEAFQLTGHIDRYRFRRIRTNPDGFALTAEVDLTITENE